VKKLLLLLLFITPLAHAQLIEGKYEIELSFGENTFIDFLEITGFENDDQTGNSFCENSRYQSRISGSFTSPDRFTVPLDQASCLADNPDVISYNGHRFSIVIVVDEGAGPVTYTFNGTTKIAYWANKLYLDGVVLVEGKEIGKFSGQYLGEVF